MPSLQDFVKGLDATVLPDFEQAELNQLVDSATPAADKGIIIVTTDSALDTPDVPNPNAAAENAKWKRYIWKRVLHSSSPASTKFALYCWDEDAASDPTFLQWRESGMISDYATSSTFLANLYTVTKQSNPTSYYAGLKVEFKAAGTNTGAAQIRIGATGAIVNLVRRDGTPLKPADILVDQIVAVQFASPTEARIMSNTERVAVFNTMADLRAANPDLYGDYDLVQLLGYWWVGDSGGGWFIWHKGNTTAVHDGGRIVQPDSPHDAKGRWIRQLFGVTPNVKMWGAKGLNDPGNVGDPGGYLTGWRDTTAFQMAARAQMHHVFRANASGTFSPYPGATAWPWAGYERAEGFRAMRVPAGYYLLDDTVVFGGKWFGDGTENAGGTVYIYFEYKNTGNADAVFKSRYAAVYEADPTNPAHLNAWEHGMSFGNMSINMRGSTSPIMGPSSNTYDIATRNDETAGLVLWRVAEQSIFENLLLIGGKYGIKLYRGGAPAFRMMNIGVHLQTSAGIIVTKHPSDTEYVSGSGYIIGLSGDQLDSSGGDRLYDYSMVRLEGYPMSLYISGFKLEGSFPGGVVRIVNPGSASTLGYGAIIIDGGNLNSASHSANTYDGVRSVMVYNEQVSTAYPAFCPNIIIRGFHVFQTPYAIVDRAHDFYGQRNIVIDCDTSSQPQTMRDINYDGRAGLLREGAMYRYDWIPAETGWYQVGSPPDTYQNVKLEIVGRQQRTELIASYVSGVNHINLRQISHTVRLTGAMAAPVTAARYDPYERVTSDKSNGLHVKLATLPYNFASSYLGGGTITSATGTSPVYNGIGAVSHSDTVDIEIDVAVIASLGGQVFIEGVGLLVVAEKNGAVITLRNIRPDAKTGVTLVGKRIIQFWDDWPAGQLERIELRWHADESAFKLGGYNQTCYRPVLRATYDSFNETNKLLGASDQPVPLLEFNPAGLVQARAHRRTSSEAYATTVVAFGEGGIVPSDTGMPLISDHGVDVIIIDNTGTGARARAIVSEQKVIAVHVISGGTGYTSPTVYFAPRYTQRHVTSITSPQATATVAAGVITTIAVTNQGAGLRSRCTNESTPLGVSEVMLQPITAREYWRSRILIPNKSFTVTANAYTATFAGGVLGTSVFPGDYLIKSGGTGIADCIIIRKILNATTALLEISVASFTGTYYKCGVTLFEAPDGEMDWLGANWRFLDGMARVYGTSYTWAQYPRINLVSAAHVHTDIGHFDFTTDLIRHIVETDANMATLCKRIVALYADNTNVILPMNFAGESIVFSGHAILTQNAEFA